VDLVSKLLSFSYREKQTRNTTKDHNQGKILEKKKTVLDTDIKQKTIIVRHEHRSGKAKENNPIIDRYCAT